MDTITLELSKTQQTATTAINYQDMSTYLSLSQAHEQYLDDTLVDNHWDDDACWDAKSIDTEYGVLLRSLLNSDIPSFREPFDFESTSESLVSPQSSCFPSENDDDNEVQFYVEEEDITDAVTTEPEDPNADLDREVDEHEDEDKVDEPDSSFEVLKLLLSVLSRVEHEDMGIFKQTNGSRRSTTPSYRALASVMPTIPEDTSIMEAEWEDLEDAEETTETLYDSRPASPPTTNLEAPLPDERFGTVTIITSGSGKTSDPHGFRRLRKFFRRAFCGL